ncbi:hypothetical protein [uncultured Cohaesibacter sp.]|uniref:hypothetical protein n=1 Tax=uncultured Cohaesibacter sp. TaxID=1002546 RepID=UPI0029C6907D|nr:hypothetical protein [uncultured Cohaesibacter sp.]
MSGPLPEILRDTGALPAPVRRMYETIYKATLTGEVEALRQPIEMNEMAASFSALRAVRAIPLIS